MTKRYVGSPVKVLDSPRLLTGRGKYVDDLTFPRMVHVAFLRSPHAHARITRLDVEPARKAAGVVAVMTSYQNLVGGKTKTQNADIFAEAVAVDRTKTVSYIQLPNRPALAGGVASIHIFAVTVF